jgi:opacity protein-like surface antigen
MRKHLALGAVLALGLGTQAFAADSLSYNLIEGGYVRGEVDDINLHGDGITIGGSLELGRNLFGFASVNSIDYNNTNLSSSLFNLGLGSNWALGPNVDLVSGVSWERIRVKASGVSASDDGIGLNVGLRGRIDQLELSGNVKYSDFGHGSNGFTLGASGRYYFTPAFAAGPDISHNDDGTNWGISFRYDFGKR